MASNMNASKVSCPGTSTKSPQQAQGTNFESLDKSSSNTLKRNPKMELSKPDLMKLLACMEGELQARDIAIATLKSEKMKLLLNAGRYQHVPFNDPHAALQRDSFAAADPRCDEAEIRAIANHQMGTLDNLVLQQRRAQLRMSRILKDAEQRHGKVIQELDEEKKKHEHDTAQGDDITYGLEKERTRLKQELELEKQAKRKVEKDLKKLSEVLEEEKNNKKHMVLTLLNDRNKYANLYLEERKRSEDLAQILTEEKGRIDSMAEGLEEESKKSLQMEAELEKQLAQFDIERQQARAALAKEEKRCKELECEADALKKQLAEAHQVAMFQAGTTAGTTTPRVVLPRPPQPPAKPVIPPTRPGPVQTSTGTPSGWGPSGDGSISPPPQAAGTPMMSSVAKVVQPTATVTSVPVCGPTTGIARSVSPGQGLRNMPYTPTTGQQPSTSTEQAPAQFGSEKRPAAQVLQVTPRVSLSAAPGTKVFTTSQGGKLTFHVTANASGSPQTPEPTPQPPPKKVTPQGSRGVPPPIPPNKPVVPPKKETVTTAIRRPDLAEPPASGDKKAVKFGITISKEKTHVGPTREPHMGPSREPQVGVDSPLTPPARTTSASLHDAPTDHEFDVLGQELADFQQIFISMAPGSSDVAHLNTVPQAASIPSPSITKYPSNNHNLDSTDHEKQPSNKGTHFSHLWYSSPSRCGYHSW